MMRLTACLAWYDEPVEMLTDLVGSLAGLADRLVAVDGGYEIAEGTGDRSPREQAYAIRDAARAAGIQPEIFVPGRVWKGQVEKRDAMMRQAVSGQHPARDWLLVVDADYVIHTDAARARYQLEQLDPDVAGVILDFWTPEPDGDYDLMEKGAHEWHRGLAGKTVPCKLLFRAWPGYRVERHHWWISAMSPGGERVAMWGCQGFYPETRETRIAASFVVEHRALLRPQHLIERNRAYCIARDRINDLTGEEP